MQQAVLYRSSLPSRELRIGIMNRNLSISYAVAWLIALIDTMLIQVGLVLGSFSPAQSLSLKLLLQTGFPLILIYVLGLSMEHMSSKTRLKRWQPLVLVYVLMVVALIAGNLGSKPTFLRMAPGVVFLVLGCVFMYFSSSLIGELIFRRLEGRPARQDSEA